LIGCWNNASTLPRAIESILNQTLRELELIVVDDGSTDETPAIVEGYDDERLRYLPIEHIGIARSLNFGIERANTDVVALQDADDWSLPTRLERQLAVLEEHPDAAAVGCWMDDVDGLERPLRPRQPRVSGDITDVLRRFNPIPGTCGMFRRHAALEVGGFDPRFRYAADYALWSRLADQHRVFCLDEVLAIRRMSGDGAGTRNERTQVGETIRIRIEAIRRRREPAAARYLLRPAMSYAAPLPLKRAMRRARRVAP
jgi:glycosyltransferase involved in cell wall biosynthesis